MNWISVEDFPPKVGVWVWVHIPGEGELKGVYHEGREGFSWWWGEEGGEDGEQIYPTYWQPLPEPPPSDDLLRSLLPRMKEWLARNEPNWKRLVSPYQTEDGSIRTLNLSNSEIAVILKRLEAGNGE